MKMSAAFAEAGYDVTLLNSASRKTEPIPGSIYEFYGVPQTFRYETLPFHRHRLSVFRYAYAAARFARRGNFDLIYGRDINALTGMATAGLPVGIELHGPAYSQKKSKHWIYRRFFHGENCRAVVAISDALKDILAGQGIPPQKLLVAHDGADRQPAPVYRTPPGGRLRVGYVGHLYKGRGVDIIFAMAEALPEHDFVIIGGRAEDIAYWRERIPAGGNVEMLGFVPPAATVELRAGCDVLLAPYQRELEIYGSKTNTSAYMSPLKIFEYMSAGRAIIVSDLPVLREVLTEENALLVPPDDAGAWIGALRKLAADQDLREGLGRRGYDDFNHHYSWQQRAVELGENLKNLL